MIKNILVKYKNLPKPLKASFWFFTCSILQKGIAFLILPIYTRLLTPEEYGNYSFYISWYGIISIFITLNLYCGVYTKGLIKYNENRDAYTSSMQGLTTFLSFFSLILFMMFSNQITSLIDLPKKLILLMILQMIFEPSIQFWMTKQRVEYRYILLLIISVTTAFLTPIISIILIIIMEDHSYAVVYGYALTQICFGAMFYLIALYKSRTVFEKNYWIEALKFNLPLIPHYLSLMILGQSDRIMINYFYGIADTGIYSFANQIASMITLVTSSLNNTLVPWTYKKMKDNDYKSIKDISTSVTSIICVLAVMIILIIPDVVKLISSSDYYEAIYLIPPLVAGIFITFIYSLFVNIEFYFDNTKFVMIASSACAILNIVLNAILLPIFGYKVAAYTTLASYFSLMVMHYFFSKKICKEQRKPFAYNARISFILALLIVVFCFFAVFIYKSSLFRYFIMSVFTIIIFKNKNKIKYIYLSKIDQKNKQQGKEYDNLFSKK